MKKKNSPASWHLFSILMSGLMLQNVMWVSPASLLPAIASDLSLDMVKAGFLFSSVCLVAAIAGPFSGYLLGKWGISKCFTVSTILVCIASIGTAAAKTFAFLIICRLVFGLGFGISLCLAASATVQWMPVEKRPYINAVYAILPYLAAAANFLLSVKIYFALGNNWRLSLAIPGFLSAFFLLLWLLKKNKPKNSSAEAKLPYSGQIWQVITNSQVRLICLADACDMWGFQFLSSFLTTFLYQSGGRSLDEASRLTAIFPVSGIFAGLFFGYLLAKTGKRKIFTWPMHLLIFFGTLLIAFGSGSVQVIGIIMAGVGNAGWAPALYTMPMEFENINGAKVAIVFSLMLSLGYMAAFISPIVGGFVAQRIGFKATIVAFSFFALAASFLCFAMKETKPKLLE